MRHEKTHLVLLFVEHEGGDGTAGIGTITSLTANTNSGMADAKMVDSAGNSTRRGRHCIAVM